MCVPMLNPLSIFHVCACVLGLSVLVSIKFNRILTAIDATVLLMSISFSLSFSLGGVNLNAGPFVRTLFSQVFPHCILHLPGSLSHSSFVMNTRIPASSRLVSSTFIPCFLISLAFSLVGSLPTTQKDRCVRSGRKNAGSYTDAPRRGDV